MCGSREAPDLHNNIFLFLEKFAHEAWGNGRCRVLVRSSEPKLVWYEVWSHDLFGPGGRVKGYAYRNEKLSCVKGIDEAITGPCEPEQKELYRSIQGKWYLCYVSSN